MAFKITPRRFYYLDTVAGAAWKQGRRHRRKQDVVAIRVLTGYIRTMTRSPDAARLLCWPPSKADNFLKWCPTVKGVVCQPEFW